MTSRPTVRRSRTPARARAEDPSRAPGPPVSESAAPVHDVPSPPPEDPETVEEPGPDEVTSAEQRALAERFLPAWLRGRQNRGLPELRWVPGRRGAGEDTGPDSALRSFPVDTATEEVAAPGAEPTAEDTASVDGRESAEPAERRSPLTRWLTGLVTRLRALGRYLLGRWRSLLQLRMVILSMVLSLLAATVVGAVLVGQVSDQLLDSRRQQAEHDAARDSAIFVSLLENSTATTSEAVEQVVREALSRVEGTEDGSASGVVLLRSDTRDVDPYLQPGFYSGRLIVDVVPEDLRTQVQSSGRQMSRSVAVTDQQTGEEHPGLIVGQSVSVPMAGQYELYFVDTLQGEQQTLLFVQRLLAVGMMVLVVLLGLVAYFVSLMVVDPVRQAGEAAGRLASGQLDERIPVKGDDELARLARSFNGMAAGLQAQIEQLEELSRVQQRFVSDVSHELRTPLTTMKMAGEIIFEARDELDPAAARSAELLNGQLDRFDSLLSDLLEISRYDAGAAALSAEAEDLRALVGGVVRDAQPLADAKPTLLRSHLPEGAVTAEIDRRRVERVLRNLVANAIEHCESKPVDVWLAADDDAVAVLVRDYGVGLTRQERSRVFDKFWRADPARTRTIGGTGLGLAISAEDAALHGGRLEVWGRPGAGAAFRLTLPRAAGGSLSGSPLPLGPRVPRSDDEPGAAVATRPADALVERS